MCTVSTVSRPQERTGCAQRQTTHVNTIYGLSHLESAKDV